MQILQIPHAENAQMLGDFRTPVAPETPSGTPAEANPLLFEPIITMYLFVVNRNRRIDGIKQCFHH
jgi:hypothetical protein